MLPPLDVAYSALLQDLLERGLLEDTVVYLGGEFGRTPRVGQNLGGGVYPDGRDHYPNCFTGVLAGGRTRPGIVYGVSDSRASAPTRDPVTMEDLTATLFAAMGLDPEAVVHTRDNRPVPVTYGQPIRCFYEFSRLSRTGGSARPVRDGRLNEHVPNGVLARRFANNPVSGLPSQIRYGRC